MTKFSAKFERVCKLCNYLPFLALSIISLLFASHDPKTNIEKYIESLKQTGSQQLELLKSLEGSVDQNQANKVWVEFDKTDSELKKYSKELEEIKLQTISQQAEILKLSLEASHKFEFLSARVNIKVRQELDFPINEDKYLKLIESGEANAKKAITWYQEMIDKHKHEL